MKVKFRNNAAAFGFGYGEGATADLPADRAKMALETCADPVKEQTETATAEKGETATAPADKPKRRGRPKSKK